MTRSGVEVGNLTTGKILNGVAQLFDRHYYGSEDSGEIITDGLKAMRRMLKRINTIAKEDPDCLPWVERPKLDRLLAEIEVFKQLSLQSEQAIQSAIRKQFELPELPSEEGRAVVSASNGKVRE